MTGNPKIALFVCDDLPGLLILNGVVPALKKMGFEPVIFNTDGHRNRAFKVPTPPVVSFFNVGLLRDQIIPFLECRPITPADNHTYRQLARLHNIEYHEKEDVNDPEFIDSLRKDGRLIGGISERFLQIFGQEIIDVFQQKGFLWNLHSGLLPEYKGLLIPYRAIDNGETEYGLTLHDMALGIDEGAILAKGALPLDPRKPVLDLYLDTVPAGIDMIVKAVQVYKQHGFIVGEPQNEPRPDHYYTNPTQEEFRRLTDQGIFYADPDTYVEYTTNAFTVAGSDTHEEMKAVLRSAMKDATKPDAVIMATAKRGRREVAPHIV